MGSGPRNRTATEYNILEFCAIEKTIQKCSLKTPAGHTLVHRCPMKKRAECWTPHTLAAKDKGSRADRESRKLHLAPWFKDLSPPAPLDRSQDEHQGVSKRLTRGRSPGWDPQGHDSTVLPVGRVGKIQQGSHPFTHPLRINDTLESKNNATIYALGCTRSVSSLKRSSLWQKWRK